jgi:hypothetical protein
MVIFFISKVFCKVYEISLRQYLRRNHYFA